MSKKPRFVPPPLVLAPVKQDVETVSERNQRIAAYILKQNVEFAAAFQDIVKEVKSTAAANMVMMGFELWRNNRSIQFKPKSAGVASGFVARIGESDFFVKSFLGGSTSGKSQIVEIFVYKLLEAINLGAQVEGEVYEGISPFLMSKDLRHDGREVYFGDAAKKILSPIFQHVESDKHCKAAVIALEIIAKILNLGDLSQNPGNYGVVVKDGAVTPVVVDFHFDPHTGNTLSERGDNVKLSGLLEDLQNSRRASESMSVGLTKAAAGTEITEEVYSMALELISGSKIQTAIEESVKYCNSFVERITDKELLSGEFNLKEVHKYIDEFNDNFALLREDVRHRRSSSSVVLDFLSRQGSGSHLQLIDGEADVFEPPLTDVDSSGSLGVIQPDLNSVPTAVEVAVVTVSSSVRASSLLASSATQAINKGNGF